MNHSLSKLFRTRILLALFAREFHAAFISRLFQIFCAIGLLGGIAAAIFTEDANTIRSFYLQVALYLISLFAVLAAVGSAQAEREEWQLLLTQPLPRPVHALGKFCALLSIFAGILLLLFLPGIFVGASPGALALYYAQTLLLAAAFIAVGLAAGYCAHDRAHALIVGVSAWLVLVFGLDLIALFAARWSGLQNFPDVWVAVLMLNPLDAFRIHSLFALEQVPAEAANKTPLASWWITHAGAWFTMIAIFWSAALVGLAGIRLNRWEE